MTQEELIALMREVGVSDETIKSLSVDKISTKAASVRQQKEYDAIAAKTAELEAELVGTTEKPGTRAYRDWYAKNYETAKQRAEMAAKYEEKYGPLDQNPPQNPQNQNQGGKQLTQEDIAALVNRQIQTQYAPNWTSLLKGSGKMIEKHLRSGRKKDIDWDKISEIAAAKGGDLSAAYDEWDAPDREIATKAATEAEISRRVKEEVAKARTNNFFPAGADATPSSTGITRPNSGQPKSYDRNAVIQAAVTGEYAPKDSVN